MAERIHNQYTADDSEIQKVLARMQQGNERLLGQMTRMRTESRQGSQENQSALSSTVVAIGKAAAAYGVLRLAIQKVNEELDRQKELGEKSIDTLIRVVESEVDVLMNSDIKTPAGRARLQSKVVGISERTGVKLSELNPAISESLSARGPLPESAALAAVEVSAGLVPLGFAGKGRLIAGGILDTMKAIDTTDALEAAGFNLAVGQKARVVNPGQFSQNIVPAIGVATDKSIGATPQEAGALAAVIGQRLNDRTGAQTGTSLQKFVIGVDTFFDKFVPQITGMSDRIERLRSDPRLQKAFTEGGFLQGEAGAKFFFKQLISDPDGKLFKEFENIRDSLPSGEEARQIARDKINLIGSLPGFDIAREQSNVEARREIAEMGQRGLQIDTVARNQLRQTLDEVSEFGIVKDSALKSFDVGLATKRALGFDPDPGDFAASFVRGARNNLAGQFAEDGIDAREQAQLDKLDRIAQGMETLVERMEENNQQQAELVSEAKAKRGSPPPLNAHAPASP